MPINTNVSDSLKLPQYALKEKILAACREHMAETGLRVFYYNIDVFINRDNAENDSVEISAEVKI